MQAEKNNGDISPAIRAATAEHGQKPYAVVVACSDSRVVPEDIFMTGIGELFVIRIPGNVIGTTQLAAVEYGVEHLGCSVVVVLGHKQCGAVGATIAGGAEGFVKTITDGIHKAIGEEKDDYKASCLNVNYGVRVLRSKIHKEGDFAVVGAIYDVKDGHVDWL